MMRNFIDAKSHHIVAIRHHVLSNSSNGVYIIANICRKLRHFPATGPEAFLDPVEQVLSQLPHPCKLRLAVFDHVSWIPFRGLFRMMMFVGARKSNKTIVALVDTRC